MRKHTQTLMENGRDLSYFHFKLFVCELYEKRRRTTQIA
jgi:hypothetical protein